MSKKVQTPTNNITFGKYILDSLSIGMYSDPLMALREYVQNSTDSIDLLNEDMLQPVIEIVVDGRNRSIEISDNGTGIPSRQAKGIIYITSHKQ